MITIDELKAICPHVKLERLGLFVEPLNAAFNEFDINNGAREAAFLAQTAHESGGFMLLRELWGPTPAQAGYEGRMDLGNEEEGDGYKFRGRGLIQITGRSNYEACGDALGLDLTEHPEFLEEPINACRSAGWFFKQHGLNELADKGDFLNITKRINGGTSGWQERLSYYARAQFAIG